jgi:hypothetical protein
VSVFAASRSISSNGTPLYAAVILSKTSTSQPRSPNWTVGSRCADEDPGASVPPVTEPWADRGYAGAGRIEAMASEALVLVAMLVTILATTWWALTPVNTEPDDRSWLDETARGADVV